MNTSTPKTLTIADKEIVLSPLAFSDMAVIEAEAAKAHMADAEVQVKRLTRLHICDDRTKLAILHVAGLQIEDGTAELNFLRSFNGSSLVLYLSARHLTPALTLKSFRADCKCFGENAAKIAELTEWLLSRFNEPQPAHPIPAVAAVQSQDNRRHRIFNAICEGEKITALELAAMAANNIGRAVELFCKYSDVKGCDPEKLKVRIDEYLAHVTASVEPHPQAA
jgi:hypothetical protein